MTWTRVVGFVAGHKRWLIVLLLAGFSVSNYVNRQALSVLAPTLRLELGITTEQYSYVISTFLAAYAIGFAFSGRLLDRLGVKVGLAIALGAWSLIGLGHAAIVGWMSLATARFFLGLAQSGNSPGGMKALSEWIPPRERGLCSAVFSNANSLGSVLAPPIVAGITLWLGWRWAFIIVGLAGFVLLAVWWWFYDRPEAHARLSERERTHILTHRPPSNSPQGDRPVPYRVLLKDRRCLAVGIIPFLTDPFAYFMAFWLIDYFQTVRGFSLQTIALLGWIPYLASPLFGGPVGGAMSDWLVRRGLDPTRARIRMMGIAACLMPLALVAVRTEHSWLAVATVTLLVAANSCWSVNRLTLSSELVPRSRVASLVSLGGVTGALGGIVAMLVAGRLIATVGYVPVFTGLGFLHLTAFGILVLLVRQQNNRMAKSSHAS
jgi:MFS transporter, ACS family, hexuronate transporter